MLVSCPDSIQEIEKGSGNTVWVQDRLSYDDVNWLVCLLSVCLMEDGVRWTQRGLPVSLSSIQRLYPIDG